MHRRLRCGLIAERQSRLLPGEFYNLSMVTVDLPTGTAVDAQRAAPGTTPLATVWARGEVLGSHFLLPLFQTNVLSLLSLSTA
jgi:hypothetical protein